MESCNHPSPAGTDICDRCFLSDVFIPHGKPLPPKEGTARQRAEWLAEMTELYPDGFSMVHEDNPEVADSVSDFRTRRSPKHGKKELHKLLRMGYTLSGAADVLNESLYTVCNTQTEADFNSATWLWLERELHNGDYTYDELSDRTGIPIDAIKDLCNAVGGSWKLRTSNRKYSPSEYQYVLDVRATHKDPKTGKPLSYAKIADMLGMKTATVHAICTRKRACEGGTAYKHKAQS